MDRDLTSLRSEIDKIDDEILELFQKRMEINVGVAEYKQAHNMPIFQSGRENEIIEKVKEKSPENLQNGVESLFLQIMDIGKSIQQQTIYQKEPFMEYEPLEVSKDCKVACFGIEGSNTEQAVLKMFNQCDIKYMETFEDVCKSVESGITDFGVIPIQNSTSGSITASYDLLKKYDLFITNTVDVSISHCLAVKEGTNLQDVKKVYSHPQGFTQCSEFVEKYQFELHKHGNTSLSAKYVKESDEPIGAICSEHCAELYGLEPIVKNISDVLPNYTKFICVSNRFRKSADANIISVIVTVPHVKGSLYRLLTKFFVCGLNLLKIESRPLLDGSFSVAFYIDFEGSIDEVRVSSLLTALRNELDYFKFLGNYSQT
ncbi:MAG: bifunctional chorismate mutase/prephenate dehydratase [Oscillospiraceae bacterium]